VVSGGYHACQAAELEAKDERKVAEVSGTTAGADDDAAADDDDDDNIPNDDDADCGDAAASADKESKSIPETPTNSSHALAAIHPNASGFAPAEHEASDGPLINAESSAELITPSCRKMAKAQDAIKRSLSLANNDLETSARSMRVKFSVRCLTRVEMSLDCAAC
jgi:hypothetical protein